MKERYTQAVRDHEERMARISAEIDAQKARMSTPQSSDSMRADLVALLQLLRGVRYTMTVGEINTIRLACDRVEQRHGIKQDEVRP